MSMHLLLSFDSPEALEAARQSAAGLDLRRVETYTPAPLSMAPVSSPLSSAMLLAAVVAFVGFFALMSWANLRAYPLDIGGRPRFAWPPYVPICFELAVLSAMVVGFFGWFVVCRRPKLYEPIDACEGFARASRDHWLLDLGAEDPAVLAEARRVLEAHHPEAITEYEA